MSKPLKPRRGTTAEHAAFIGQAHEVTYDTDKQTLVCHDGLTAGGFPLARADEVAAKDAAQDEAIAEAQSSADAASEEVTALDTTLRQLIVEELAKYLPLAGGTMTGTIIANRDVISGRELDQAITIKAHAGGPQLNLFGSEYNGEYAGVAELVAQNGTQRSGLGVFPDGRLRGPSGSEVPQYSRWANYAGAWWIGRSNTFTAPGPGWLSISMAVGNHDWFSTGKFILVNGVAVMRLFAYSGSWAGLCNNMLLPLNTGDVVSGLAQTTSDLTLDAWFIPIK